MIMNTRSCTRLMGAFGVLTNQNFETTSNVTINFEFVAKNQAKARGPVARQDKLILSPVKKPVLSKQRPTTRVSKTRAAIVLDDESESSQIF